MILGLALKNEGCGVWQCAGISRGTTVGLPRKHIVILWFAPSSKIGVDMDSGALLCSNSSYIK